MSACEITPAKTRNGIHALIDELLADQRDLPAAARFAGRHERHELPAQAKYYRDLIPLTAPKPGEQYAFEVDLDKCSGCKACVTACHNLNGLDEEETWRETGLLYSDDWRAPFQATVTTACHHCVDPGCLTGCPVLAYDKDPTTGIVRHLDDQCIGCQYCVMKCPYEVPKYSKQRGIVRKCDMCSSRLSHGEAPACVQACPSQAIRITVVNQHEVQARFRYERRAGDGKESSDARISSPSPLNGERAGVRGEAVRAASLFLPASPAPHITVPTTRYKSSKPLPANLLAGDHAHVSPANPHLPLVFMLVFSQLAVGLSAVAPFINQARWFSLTPLTVLVLALAAGTLHLGQPLKAWRAFLGWRTSWFSREVLVFGALAPVLASGVAAFWITPMAAFYAPLAFIAPVVGLLGVACSAMIYADTHREFWRASQSFGKFFTTTLILGLAAVLVAVSFASTASHLPLLVALLGAATAAKLTFEHRIFQHLVDEETPAPTPLNKSARLLAGRLGLPARLRIVCGAAGGIVLPLLLALTTAPSRPLSVALAFSAFALSLAGELLERYLFFAAVAPSKMPGGFAA